MDFKGFLMSDIAQTENVKVKISNRFPREFELKAITEEKDKLLRNESYKRIKGKNGMTTKEIDQDLYLKKLAVATVVVPDFNNAELQKNWGVLGAESVLEKMFLPGELNELLMKVREVNGYDLDPTEIIEEAKN